MTDTELRQSVVSKASLYIGCEKGSEKHKEMIDFYNDNCRDSQGRLPRGYRVSYTDSYCATAVSSWWCMANVGDIVPFECGVQEMVNKASTMGIWVENDNFVPQIGDAIVFSWGGKENAENTGYAKHIALISGVDGCTIHTINPNTNGGKTERTDFEVGDKDIRGFICPKYRVLANDDEKADKRYITPKKRYFYIDKGVHPCNIQQGAIIRNYMLDTDRFEILGEDGDYYRIAVKDWTTWYPLVKKSDCE